jgi:hypothetical protein
MLSPSSQNYEDVILEPVPHHLTSNPEVHEYALYSCRSLSEIQCLQLGFRAIPMMGLTAWIVDCHPGMAGEVPPHDKGDGHGHTVLVVQAEESAEFVMGCLKGITSDEETLEFFLVPEGVTGWRDINSVRQQEFEDNGGVGSSESALISSSKEVGDGEGKSSTDEWLPVI